VTAGYKDALRRLTLNDERILESDAGIQACSPPALDAKTCALSRLGALAATQGTPTSYQWIVSSALDAGASVDEIVAVLMAIAPIVGVARVVQAAPDVALALGYDVEAALERLLEPVELTTGEGAPPASAP
jgi:4-carboxymuconolactone decarboxylase